MRSPTDSYTFFLTAIYASPNFTKRKILWNYLKDLSPSIRLPWVLLGDFNDMLSEDETMGGLPLTSSRINAFQDYLDYCGLMDLGFHGPKFTWTNKNLIWYHNIIIILRNG